jgi:hypothetical protein
MPLLHRVAGVKPSSLQGEQRRLAQRFQNRLELRMILSDLAKLKKMGAGMYKSMDRNVFAGIPWFSFVLLRPMIPNTKEQRGGGKGGQGGGKGGKKNR